MVLKSFTTIIFCYVGQTPPETCSGDQEDHENVSFFIELNVEFFRLIVFGKISSSILMFLVMLLAHVEKRSNSRSQMFSKTGVVKNCAIFTGKTCVEVSLGYSFRTEDLYFYLKRDSNAGAFL